MEWGGGDDELGLGVLVATSVSADSVSPGKFCVDGSGGEGGGCVAVVLASARLASGVSR